MKKTSETQLQHTKTYIVVTTEIITRWRRWKSIAQEPNDWREKEFIEQITWVTFIHDTNPDFNTHFHVTLRLLNRYENYIDKSSLM